MTIAWAILAAACLVVELLTGTLYLLVLCAAFAVACALSALDINIPVQLTVATVAGMSGLLVVHRWRTRNAKHPPMPIIERPQATIVTTHGPGYRVRWRGTEWDATGPQGLADNTSVTITGQTGNTLHITPR
ncbi:NfeD family protein [Uliginosibacterium gangwonense]|uniref:NfeD family protein n=1 Tax=Uliginosibacterium gangwonense TaxID=392736 RepID=UPI00037A61EF|nr:NfeD family protein [Uliginosibacterium gangwonense]